MKTFKKVKDKFWNHKRCCFCCSLRTGVIYFVITDCLLLLTFFFYTALFMSVDESHFDESVISAYSIFNEFFNDDMTSRAKYLVVRNVLVIS